MASLHSKKTIIFAYTMGFILIIGCLLVKKKSESFGLSTTIATELDVTPPIEQSTTFEQAVEQRLEKRKKPTDRSRFPIDVSAKDEQGIYHLYTVQGLEEFVSSHTDKPVVVKFANQKACSPCKAFAPTYALSAKFLKDEAYFAEIDENEFDDLEYFASIAPAIPAVKIYNHGELTPVKELPGLRNRTHIKQELDTIAQEEARRKKQQ